MPDSCHVRNCYPAGAPIAARNVLLAAALLLGGYGARADAPAPKWELGMGLGALHTADYVGSAHRQSYLAPLPYVIYRGKRVQADRDGLRSTLFSSDRVELKLSLTAMPPAKDRDIEARDGMPDLDPAFEVGPELRWHIGPREAVRSSWELRLPLRLVFGMDGGGMESIGTTFSPAINLDLREPGAQGWKLGLNAGPVFGDESLHDYYYGVKARYATSTRPAWAARSGYGGLQFTTALTRRRGKLWIGAFLRLRDLHHAEFHNSPLVERSNSMAAGIGFAYIFATSDEQVAVAE